MSDEMRFTLLGSLRAWRGESELDIGQAKVRAVLASLLLRAGGQVGNGQLAQDLWGAETPPSAEALIRTYVHRLRKGLGSSPGGRIRSTNGGYALEFDPRSVDLTVFERLVDQARTAREESDPAQAALLYGRGLALWSGPPLAGVPGPYAEMQRTRLEGRRLAAAEERLTCMLTAGKYADAAAGLATLVADHPLVERFRELLMVALYGAGRQADALAVFQDARRLLREELGVDPAPGLRETHRRVLAGDPALAAPAVDVAQVDSTAPQPPPQLSPSESTPPQSTPPRPTTSPAAQPESFRTDFPSPAGRPGPAAPWITPAQVPAPLPRFVGRKDALGRLTALLTDDDACESAVTSVIHGMPGIGKTTLAVQAAHLVRGEFPDGQLYVNLRGFDGVAALTPHEVLADFLGALGVPADRIPASTDARPALYRSALAGRRVLILLDNARDADHVRPLLAGAPGCPAVITSRNQLPGLTLTHQAHYILLDPFDEGESREYLTTALGTHRVDSQLEAADEIIGHCAGLPLALAIVAARTAHLPDADLAAITRPLRTAHDRLDALALGRDPSASARTAFSWSYQSLDPAPARLFRLLSLHPGPEITPMAAATAVGTSTPEVRPLLADLCGVHLLTERSPDRYSCHDLLRDYADELSREGDAEADRAAAVDRLLDYYVHSVDAADRMITSSRQRRIAPLPRRRSDAAVEQFADEAEAQAWLHAEYSVLVAAVKWAADRQADAEAWLLGWFLNARRA